MVSVDEIAPDVFRLCVFVPEFNLQFAHFLVRDDEPLLYHTGMRRMFPLIREAAATLIDVKKLRWIGYSHFEVDECGALNDWLGVAPRAQAVAGFVGAMVNLSDFSDRPARMLQPGEVFTTGKRRYRYVPTPHLPHGWDAGVLFEETDGIVFCSDLFHHEGDNPALTNDDLLGKVRATLRAYQSGPLMNYIPYHTRVPALLNELAALKPRTLAVMHGSSFRGDCAKALIDLDGALKEIMS
ncbi:MAG: MBL fold metallo-hydrolase [Planctomycetes bacterium]|nr:MBL fold metallo-hydrolase [Planctomycetota bacterium]